MLSSSFSSSSIFKEFKFLCPTQTYLSFRLQYAADYLKDSLLCYTDFSNLTCPKFLLYLFSPKQFPQAFNLLVFSISVNATYRPPCPSQNTGNHSSPCLPQSTMCISHPSIFSISTATTLLQDNIVPHLC